MKYFLLFIFLISCDSNHQNNDYYYYELPISKSSIRFPSEPNVVDVIPNNNHKLVYYKENGLGYYLEYELFENDKSLDYFIMNNKSLVSYDSKKKKSLTNFKNRVFGLDTLGPNNYAGIYVKNNVDGRSLAYIHITNDFRLSVEVSFSPESSLTNEEKFSLFNEFTDIDVKSIANYYNPLSKELKHYTKIYDIDY